MNIKIIIKEYRIFAMRFFYAAVLVILFGNNVVASEFSWSFLGKPGKNSVKPEIALFDKAVNFNTNRIIWDGKYSVKGCGVMFQFDKTVELTRVEVFTSKPNHLPMAPIKTEFVLWDDEKSEWESIATIKDVTGRATDKKFTSATIKTSWKAPAQPTRALKILMYGGGIWLTEIKLFGKDSSGKEYLLVPGHQILLPDKSNTLDVNSFGGGSSANITTWKTTNSWVGNPNVLTRKDRVVFNFDLTSYIESSKIEKAVLTLPLQPAGLANGNWFELECFKGGQPQISKMDLISNNVFPVSTMLVDSKSPLMHYFDVTKIVNNALSQGNGSISFRVRNVTVEKLGNRKNRPECGIIDSTKLKMLVVK